MLRRAFEWFGGSVLVYVLVAACAATGSNIGPSDGGAGNGSNDQGDDGIVNPVPGAEAAEDGDRLKVVRVTTPDGLSLPTGSIWDPELDAECSRGIAEDGTERCIPGGATAQPNLFTDAECTQRAAIRSGCVGSVKYATEAVPVDSGACAGSTASRVFEVLESSATLYTKSGVNCTNSTASYAAWTFYRLGDLVPPTDLVALTVSHN